MTGISCIDVHIQAPIEKYLSLKVVDRCLSVDLVHNLMGLSSKFEAQENKNGADRHVASYVQNRKLAILGGT